MFMSYLEMRIYIRLKDQCQQQGSQFDHSFDPHGSTDLAIDTAEEPEHDGHRYPMEKDSNSPFHLDPGTALSAYRAQSQSCVHA